MVCILGYGFYVGFWFKNWFIYSYVIDDIVEFFIDYDGEVLFLFLLFIKLFECLAGG